MKRLAYLFLSTYFLLGCTDGLKKREQALSSCHSELSDLLRQGKSPTSLVYRAQNRKCEALERELHQYIDIRNQASMRGSD